MKIVQIIEYAKESNSSFIGMLWRRFFFLTKKRNIITSSNVKIVNIENIETGGLLKIGIDYNGFLLKKDYTLLNLRGKIVFRENYSIGKGCRIDVGPNAIIDIGKNGYMNAFTKLIISHSLKIGDNCAISWNCQFLDDDFHTLNYENKKEKQNNGIIIGNKVLIGCNTSIYKGVVIPNGCVIASDSVIKTSFTEENLLIGGNPARILNRNVKWE